MAVSVVAPPALAVLFEAHRPGDAAARLHVEAVRARTAQRRHLVRPDGVEGDAAGARALPRERRRAGAADQVAGMPLDHEAPLALRSRALDRVEVVGAASRLRPGRPPRRTPRDGERDRRAEYG